MASEVIDISNQRFGRLVVLNFHHTEKRVTFWECQCDCGKKRIIRKSALISKATKSCGCLKTEMIKLKKPCLFGSPKSHVRR